MTHEVTKLDNGLTVITETMTEVPSITLNIGVNNGSRYETPELNGISHFLEHMAFKGTKRRNAQQIAEEFDAVGGYLNASTDREHTIYHAKFLKEDLPLAVDILADILQHSVFEAEEIERERSVITQEIAQSNDTPDDIVFDYFMNTAFPGQPLGRNILGNEETIMHFTGDTLRSYMHRNYAASRMVVAAAGNISHVELVQLVSDFFTHFPEPATIHKEPLRYGGGYCPVRRDLEQINVVLGLEGCSYHDPDYYTTQMLSTIFGGSMSSRLFQEVREKRGLAYTIQSFSSSYEDGGIFGIFAGTSEENINELLTVLYEELLKLEHTITDHEMKRARSQLKAGLLMGQESASGRADDMTRNMLAYGRHITVDELILKIESISRHDLSAVAARLLQPRNLTITAIGNVHNIIVPSHF